MSLKCNGKGFLRGVPRRDLNDKEVKQYGGEEFLLSTGLYYKEAKVDQYFAGAKINVGSWDELMKKREGQLPAAPEKPKRKKGKPNNTLTEG